MFSSDKSAMSNIELKLLGLAAAFAMSIPSFAGDMDAAIRDIGRPATANELAAWDIDVRPDFKGLPAGSGNAEDGEEIWLEKCAVCHGDFGDSNEVFSPLALGNVTEEDIETGRVAALTDRSRTRTTLMKVATVSTLFDYINRAMPWNAPKSLEVDEVYSLVAYLLSLGYIIEPDFELSNETIAEAQARMPNRNGMTRDHGMWSVSDKPDVNGSSCTKNCDVDTTITSRLPEYAMNAHGNLKAQVRDYGPMPGINTDPDAADASAEAASPVASEPTDLLAANTCSACHQLDSKLIGPAFNDVKAKYADRDDAVAYLSGKIRNGGSGVWGGMMPPMPNVSDEDIAVIANWLAGK